MYDPDRVVIHWLSEMTSYESNRPLRTIWGPKVEKNSISASSSHAGKNAYTSDLAPALPLVHLNTLKVARYFYMRGKSSPVFYKQPDLLIREGLKIIAVKKWVY